MDQSLFAAPHGLSQRITSFIACACQGIHQMPLRHLIVLIANAHRLVAPKGRRRTRLPFTTPSTQQCHRRVRHDPIAGTPVHCEVMSLRPASRDLSDDARSGNINPASSVRDFFAHLSRRILRSFAPRGRQTIGDGPQPYQSMVNNNNASGQASLLPPIPPPYPAG